MGKMLDNLKEWFDSEEGKKSLDEWAEKQKFNDELNQKYFNKFNSLTKQERRDLCRKIHDKYISKKYLDKEYKVCYEPRCELYYLLFEYGLRYGKPYEDENEKYVPTECYLIDDDIVIEMIYGQGSLCTMFFLK